MPIHSSIMHRGLDYWIWAFFAIHLPLQKSQPFCPPPNEPFNYSCVRWHRILPNVVDCSAGKGAPWGMVLVASPECGKIAVWQLCKERQPVWNSHDLWWPELKMLGSMPLCSFPRQKLLPKLAQKNCHTTASLFRTKLIYSVLPHMEMNTVCRCLEKLSHPRLPRTFFKRPLQKGCFFTHNGRFFASCPGLPLRCPKLQ